MGILCKALENFGLFEKNGTNIGTRFGSGITKNFIYFLQFYSDPMTMEFETVSKLHKNVTVVNVELLIVIGTECFCSCLYQGPFNTS